jgi:hypothetical protein
MSNVLAKTFFQRRHKHESSWRSVLSLEKERQERAIWAALLYNTRGLMARRKDIDWNGRRSHVIRSNHRKDGSTRNNFLAQGWSGKLRGGGGKESRLSTVSHSFDRIYTTMQLFTFYLFLPFRLHCHSGSNAVPQSSTPPHGSYVRMFFVFICSSFVVLYTQLTCNFLEKI